MPDAATAVDASISWVTPPDAVRSRAEHAAQVDVSADSTDAQREAGIEFDEAEPVDQLEPVLAVEGVWTGLGGVFFLIEALRQFRDTEPDRTDWELAGRCGW